MVIMKLTTDQVFTLLSWHVTHVEIYFLSGIITLTISILYSVLYYTQVNCIAWGLCWCGQSCIVVGKTPNWRCCIPNEDDMLKTSLSCKLSECVSCAQNNLELHVEQRESWLKGWSEETRQNSPQEFGPVSGEVETGDGGRRWRGPRWARRRHDSGSNSQPDSALLITLYKMELFIFLDFSAS